MPLRNRLDEVIRRYDRATSLVRQFQDGELSEEELGSRFKRLREERRSIDEHNRVFLSEERRSQLGETIEVSEGCEDLTGSEEVEIDCDLEEEDSDKEEEDESGEEEGSEEEEDSEEEDSESDEEEEDGICEEDAEEENDVAMEPDGDNGAAVERKKPSRKREDKLWEEYGSFWRST